MKKYLEEARGTAALIRAGEPVPCSKGSADQYLLVLDATVETLTKELAEARKQALEQQDRAQMLAKELSAYMEQNELIAEMRIADCERADSLAAQVEALETKSRNGEALVNAFRSYQRYYEYTPKANGVSEQEQENRRRSAYLAMMDFARFILPDEPGKQAGEVFRGNSHDPPPKEESAAGCAGTVGVFSRRPIWSICCS